MDWSLQTARVAMRLLKLRTVISILSVLAWPGTSSGKGGGTSIEYRVKGAYLYNFAKFIDWPRQSFRGPASPLTICTMGPDPFSSEFKEQLEEKRVHERPLVLWHIETLEQASSCHILFVLIRNRASVQRVILGLKGKSILLVGEAPGFNDLGGMIQFVFENDKVRFEIDPSSVEQSGLKASSKLLHVAKPQEQR
jgi:hypothetical protein